LWSARLPRPANPPTSERLLRLSNSTADLPQGRVLRARIPWVATGCLLRGGCGVHVTSRSCMSLRVLGYQTAQAAGSAPSRSRYASLCWAARCRSVHTGPGGRAAVHFLLPFTSPGPYRAPAPRSAGASPSRLCAGSARRRRPHPLLGPQDRADGEGPGEPGDLDAEGGAGPALPRPQLPGAGRSIAARAVARKKRDGVSRPESPSVLCEPRQPPPRASSPQWGGSR
jgi:hypothetical protein